MNTSNVFLLQLPSGPVELCTVVMSVGEFSDFLDAVLALGLAPAEAVAAFREKQHVPFISRGTKTEALFQLCGVNTQAMGAIVRGAGPKIIDEILRPDHSVN